MDQAREIAERYHLGGEIDSTRELRSLRAIDRATGEAVVFELVPRQAWSGDDGAAASEVGPRFAVAAALLATLRHPSLPALFDHGVTVEGDLYLVREAAVDQGIDALAGEPPEQVLGLLVGVVEALDLLAGHGFHHGALSGETVRVAQATGGPRGLVVGLAQGLAETVVAGRPDPAARRRDDLRSLAALTCRLLGATVFDPAAAEPGVKLPLGVSFELEDAEALRLALEGCLRRDAGGRPAGYRDLRAALCLAAWGVPRVPDEAVGEAAGPAPPPARLTFSTVPPDEGWLATDATGAATGAAAPPPVPALHAAARAGAADDAGGTDGVTGVILEDELRGGLEDTAPGLSPPDSDLEETAPGLGGIVTGLEDTSPDLEGTLGRAAGGAETQPGAAGADGEVEAPPEWIAATDREEREETEEADELDAGSGGLVEPAESAIPTPVFIAEPPLPPVEPAPEAGPAVIPSVTAPRRRRWVLAAVALAAVVAVIAVVAVAAALWLGAGRRAPAAAPPPPTAAFPGAPASSAPLPAAVPLPTFARHRKLLEAKVLLVNGDDAGASAALAAIPPEEEGSFTAADCELADWLAASLAASGDQRLAAELERGLAAGDLDRLRRTVAAAGAAGTSFLGRYPGAADGLARARRALALDAEARRAFDGGDYPQAIEAAGRLLADLPGAAAAGALRERAAAELEAGAETAFAGGRYEEAIERLGPLAQVWPDRSGLDERRERYRGRLRADRDLDAVLTSAAAAGERGEPDAGLALLDGVAADGDGSARLAAARHRLEERLADLDRQPPRIELAPATASEIVKDAPAVIAVRVSDDYRVVRVAIFARPEGGSWVELPARRSGGEASAEVGADLHGNKNLDFYVTAADLSGHGASLGSAAEPLQIQRRKWIRRLFGG